MMAAIIVGAVIFFIIATVCMCAMYTHTFKSDYDKKIDDAEQEEAVKNMNKPGRDKDELNHRGAIS